MPFGLVADRVLDELGRRGDSPDGDAADPAHVVLDTQVDLVVTTSPPRLEALLLHLLDHACGRSPGGIVVLRAAMAGDDRLRIEVGDRGDVLEGTGDDWFAPAVRALRPVPDNDEL